VDGLNTAGVVKNTLGNGGLARVDMGLSKLLSEPAIPAATSQAGSHTAIPMFRTVDNLFASSGVILAATASGVIF
jgi:hypothetical protein